MRAGVERRISDILKAGDLDAIANPVNCQGTMGAGLARQFRERYPQMMMPYRQACKTGALSVTTPFIFKVSRDRRPIYVVNIATKQEWKRPSRLEWVESGLRATYPMLEVLGARSIGLPMLGAGLGGLKPANVREVVEQAAAEWPYIRTVLFTG